MRMPTNKPRIKAISAAITEAITGASHHNNKRQCRSTWSKTGPISDRNQGYKEKARRIRQMKRGVIIGGVTR